MFLTHKNHGHHRMLCFIFQTVTDNLSPPHAIVPCNYVLSSYCPTDKTFIVNTCRVPLSIERVWDRSMAILHRQGSCWFQQTVRHGRISLRAWVQHTLQVPWHYLTLKLTEKTLHSLQQCIVCSRPKGTFGIRVQLAVSYSWNLANCLQQALGRSKSGRMPVQWE